MAFRIPVNLLSDYHKTRIKTDLILKEKAKFHRGKNPYSNHQSKEITFYIFENEDILLPMHYASTLLGAPHINKRKVYPKIKPFDINVTLRPEQVEIVEESLKYFTATGSTFLNVFCSFGKTVVAAYFAAMFSKTNGLCTLVTYPISLVGNSWIGTFKSLTNAKVFVVGEDKGEPDDDVQVFLCMDTRVMNLSPAIRARVGHYVIDEADCYCAPGQVQALLGIEPLYITFLTATYERDDGFHIMLDLMGGSNRITRISKKPFFVFKRETQFTPEPKSGSEGIVYDSLLAELDNIDARNLDIIQMVLDNMEEKILVLTYHVDHAKKLVAYLSYYLQAYGKTCVGVYGDLKNYNDADVIVGTTKKMGRGFDEKEACNNWNGKRINMLLLVASTRKPEQYVGRVFRADIPIIIDYVDNHKNINGPKGHYNDRRKWYEPRNGIIYPITERFSWAQHKDQIVSRYFNKT